ncbi:MAG: ANTAR domain-containing response regulator [Bacillota bacterium]
MRVLLAVSDPGTRMTVRELLIHRGYVITGEADNASEALRKCRSQPVEMVVMDTELEGGRISQVAMILEEDAVASVLILASNVDSGIKDFNYILKPVTASNLIPAIESTLANYRKRMRLMKEVDRLQKQLATRKAVDMAKGILMLSQGMSEEQAHRFLQKASMDKGLPLKKVADTVIAFNKKSMKGESE